jgi:pilus assembly protein Flp/PilA
LSARRIARDAERLFSTSPAVSTAVSILLKSFAGDECGATAIEYALICALIAVFLIGALAALGTNLSSEFAEVGAALK